jgi:hypothetical protein
MTFKPDRRRVRKNELAARYGCTVRTIDNRVARGALPAPHRDELDRPFWWSDEIALHEAKLDRRAEAAA